MLFSRFRKKCDLLHYSIIMMCSFSIMILKLIHNIFKSWFSRENPRNTGKQVKIKFEYKYKLEYILSSSQISSMHTIQYLNI